MNTPNIGKSILASSDPSILQTLSGIHGELKVRAISEIDTHGLFFTQDGNEHLITMHPNGYSCHALAKRIIDVWNDVRPAQYAIDQYKYIIACGGMTKDDETMLYIISPL